MEKDKNSFRATLNLPVTTFPIRAHAASKEPEILHWWSEHNIAARAQECNKGAEKSFVLHDGPPYANGHIHMGTTLNKVLKDIVVKAKRMAGYHAPFIPGWDCHGLPIELKVTDTVPVPEKPTDEQRVLFKKECRAFAQQWIEIQKKEFQALGVFAQWDAFYATMSYEYQASIIRAFARFVDQGYIERKGRTVPWCSSCKTVLAQAEIEYYDRKDPSLYVGFETVKQTEPEGLQKLQRSNSGILPVHVLIWTTTPWTLPLNRAVIAHPKALYTLVRFGDDEALFLMRKEVVERLASAKKCTVSYYGELVGEDLRGLMLVHPFERERSVPLVLDESVVCGEGTAFVHSAPGCGPEDYLIGVRNNLEIYSPLSDDGCYTDGVIPAFLRGTAISDAHSFVITYLLEQKKLVHKESVIHSYPHCWRCKKGLMFRATDQWFCDLQKNNLVELTLSSLASVTFVPSSGKNRLSASIAHRTEWCISRQRLWGTPIIALFCLRCKEPFLQSTFINEIASGIEQMGIEYWDDVDLATVRTPIACGRCGNNDVTMFTKERDILDVWFDSGISHYAVLTPRGASYCPASLYLEGSDQHRGWFQSAVLTSMVLNHRPPMEAIFTHGYVVDDKGHKMSKSLGNVIAPEEVIKEYSVDILRLWVASTDVEKDCVISKKLLDNVAEVYRKIRNTCRFLLANLADFSYPHDAVALDALLLLDRYALEQNSSICKTIKAAYEHYDFTTVYATLAHYCSVQLSAFYLDIIKDRLYVERSDGHLRRSAQTVLWHILDSLTHLMAPITSFLAEEVYGYYKKEPDASIHLELFLRKSSTLSTTEGDRSGLSVDQAVWEFLHSVRSVVLKAIEQERAAGRIKHSLEARVILSFELSGELGNNIDAFCAWIEGDTYNNRFFSEWFVVSQCVIIPPSSRTLSYSTALDGVFVAVEQAHGLKCPRCWQFSETMRDDHLCGRCVTLRHSGRHPEGSSPLCPPKPCA